MHVKSDFITSDHLPLSFSTSIDNLHVPIPPCDNPSQDTLSYDWYGASDVNLYNYNLCTRVELAKLKLYFDAQQRDDIHCISHCNDIDKFYYNQCFN